MPAQEWNEAAEQAKKARRAKKRKKATAARKKNEKTDAYRALVKTLCGTCNHGRAFHRGTERCASAGCHCVGWVDKPAVLEEPSGNS